MEPAVIAAIISVCGVFLSAIISLIIGFWTKRFNYNQLFAQTVSSNRMNWINVWRENVAKFISAEKALKAGVGDEVKKCELLKEREFARSMIAMQLNLTEQLHLMMLKLLQNTDCEVCESVYEYSNKIEELARQILKPEWERVKEEAYGKRK